MNLKQQADKLFSRLMKEEVNGEIVYYRKRKVYPIFNEDGSVNWFNFVTGGSWKRVIFTLIVIGIITGFFFEYASNLKAGMECINQMNIIKNISLGGELLP